MSTEGLALAFIGFIQLIAMGVVSYIISQMNKNNDKTMETIKHIYTKLEDITHALHQMQMDIYRSYVKEETFQTVQRELDGEFDKVNKRIDSVYYYGCSKYSGGKCPPPADSSTPRIPFPEG